MSEANAQIQYKQVVAGILIRHNRILICQRREDQPFALQWEFPGGKLEPGELAPAALARELEEELGISATIGDEVHTVRYVYASGTAVELHFFVVRQYEGTLENRIFRKILWEERESLTSYEFLEADREVVTALARGQLV